MDVFAVCVSNPTKYGRLPFFSPVLLLFRDSILLRQTSRNPPVASMCCRRLRYLRSFFLFFLVAVVMAMAKFTATESCVTVSLEYSNARKQRYVYISTLFVEELSR